MDIAMILTHKYEGTEWALDGEDYAGLTWLSEGDPPTETELTALWPKVVAEIEAEKQAKKDRKQSAISKLEKLGLTVDEVRDVFGIEV